MVVGQRQAAEPGGHVGGMGHWQGTWGAGRAGVVGHLSFCTMYLWPLLPRESSAPPVIKPCASIPLVS